MVRLLTSKPGRNEPFVFTGIRNSYFVTSSRPQRVFHDNRIDLILDETAASRPESLSVSIRKIRRRGIFVPSSFEARRVSCSYPGAIGFDWVTIDDGGVPWLISRPRKKPIK